MRDPFLPLFAGFFLVLVAYGQAIGFEIGRPLVAAAALWGAIGALVLRALIARAEGR